MSDGIQFNDEQDVQFNPARFTQNGMPGSKGSTFSLTGLVQKSGFVRNEQQAQNVLLTIGILCLLVASYIIFHNVLGFGNARTKIRYNIDPKIISKYPPALQKQLTAAQKK